MRMFFRPRFFRRHVDRNPQPSAHALARGPRRWPWIALVVAIAIGIGIRLALPGWIAEYVNGQLDRMGEYHGELADVDLHLWRGAYSIDDLRIERRNSEAPPLLQAPRLNLSISWRALLDGGIVASADFDRPEINFIDGPLTQNGKGVDWRAKLENLLPIRLDEVRVHDGTVRFRNPSSRPKVDLKATHFNGTVFNLTNIRGAGPRPARLDATARILESAPFETHADFDPFGALEDFRFDVKATDIDLTKANDFLQAYVKLDAAAGRGDFVMQLEARDGQLTGYAKPLLQHVKIFNWKQDVEQQGDNPLRVVWEAVAGGVQNLFKNAEMDQFATRIEIRGRIGDTKTSTWQSIVAVLHNAFVEAFRPQFERLPTRGPDDDP
jgi:hypothetical protein